MIARILSFALGVVLFAVALVFASVLALLAGIVVAAFWIYLQWRLRGLARHGADVDADSTVIEGEYRVERETPQLQDGEETARRGSGRDDR